MKKFLGLFLTVVFFCSMLATYAIPALAEGFNTITGTVEINENDSLQNLIIDSGAKVTVKKGVTLTVGVLMNNGTLIIEPGSTVIARSGFFNNSDSTLELGGTLSSDFDNDYNWLSFIFLGNVTIKSGGIIDAVVSSDDYLTLLKDLNDYCVHISEKRFTVHSEHNMVSGVCSQCHKNPCEINGESHLFKKGKCTKCGYACTNAFHRNHGECPECGMKVDFSVGSVFSGGEITVIVGFAGILIGMAIMFLIMRKKTCKKQAPPDVIK